MKRFLVRIPLASALLLGTFVALILSACAESQTGGPTDTTATAGQQQGGPVQQSDGAMQQGRRGSRQGAVTAQSTVTLLRKGVRNVASNRAVQNINGWQKKLQQQGGAEQSLSQIDSTLGELKTELLADRIDGPATGALLSKLGQQTTQAAQNASGSTAQQLRQLGQLLTQAGNQMPTR
jgi:hypothetical protein